MILSTKIAALHRALKADPRFSAGAWFLESEARAFLQGEPLEAGDAAVFYCTADVHGREAFYFWHLPLALLDTFQGDWSKAGPDHVASVFAEARRNPAVLGPKPR